ncbi:MAG: hypothetical protein LAP40_10145 [Acidobacteriia bacterium]|nr:hypothetical protein [Terriglobia bacterium]
MKKTILLAMTVAGLAMGAAKSYSITLNEPALLGAMPLASGDYRVEVADQKAVVHNSKFHGEAPVKVESVDYKYISTSVRYDTSGGKLRIQEIHIGGTKTKLVFDEQSALAASTSQRP